MPWIHRQYLDRFIVQVQAELDTLMEGLLWLRAGIHICVLLGLHKRMFMIDCCVNDSIANCLELIRLSRESHHLPLPRYIQHLLRYPNEVSRKYPSMRCASTTN